MDEKTIAEIKQYLSDKLIATHGYCKTSTGENEILIQADDVAIGIVWHDTKGGASSDSGITR